MIYTSEVKPKEQSNGLQVMNYLMTALKQAHRVPQKCNAILLKTEHSIF